MKYFKKTSIINAAFTIVFLALSTASLAAVPNAINYQGYLTNAADEPINATQVMTFRIYSQANGGIELWSESKSVVIDQGAFATVLGDGSSPFPNDLFDGPLYLGISINSDSEMSPRSPLTSAPFALNAERLDGQTADDLSYTDAEARAAMGTRSDTNDLNHDRYTDFEARSAMGNRSNTNDLNHDRYTDFEARAAMGTRSDNNDLNHDKYTNANAVSAMGTRLDNNPLNHDKYTNANAVAAIQAADGAGSNIDADLLDGMQASDIIAAASGPEGTPITSIPFNISSPGNYFLANDVSGTQGIRVGASDVNLNLNGHTITNTSSSIIFTAVSIRAANQSNIKVFNGTVRGVVGARSTWGIELISGDNYVVDGVTLLDTDGVRVQGYGSRITNNVINGDSQNSGNQTPSIVSQGLSMTVSSGALIQGNTIHNSFSTSNNVGGIQNLNSNSIIKNNTIFNVRNANGTCIYAAFGTSSSVTPSLIIENTTRLCTAIGSNAGDIQNLDAGNINNLNTL